MAIICRSIVTKAAVAPILEGKYHIFRSVAPLLAALVEGQAVRNLLANDTEWTLLFLIVPKLVYILVSLVKIRLPLVRDLLLGTEVRLFGGCTPAETLVVMRGKACPNLKVH